MTTVAPSAQSLLDQANVIAPNRNKASDGTIGDPAHAARVSDHNPDSRGIVHAADVTDDPAHGMDIHMWADVIRLRAKAGKEPRLKYVISKRRIASPSSDWEWRYYDGSNSHTLHAHFSVNSDSTENDDSLWYVITNANGEELTMADIRDILDAEQDTRRLILTCHLEEMEEMQRILAAEWRTRQMLRDAGVIPESKPDEAHEGRELDNVDKRIDSLRKELAKLDAKPNQG